MDHRPVILFIEDEDQQREALLGVMEAEGFTVRAVPSAEQALRQLERETPDMIVTDVKLPGMDGITMYEKIREGLPVVPFLFITGYNDPRAIDHVRNLGATAYVTKPYELEDLLELIRKSLPNSGSPARS